MYTDGSLRTISVSYCELLVERLLGNCIFHTQSQRITPQMSQNLSRGGEVYTLEKSSDPSQPRVHKAGHGAEWPLSLVHTRSTGAELSLCTLTPKMLHLNPATRTPVSRWTHNEKYSVKRLTSTKQCHKEKKRNVLEQSYLRDITFKCNEKSLAGS